MSSLIWPWEYDDRNKRTLRVAPSPGKDAAADVQTASGHVVAVDVADLPGLIAALYAAAGRPEPVILDWTVLLSIGGDRDALTSGAARDLAARLAVLADEADSEPDPAEVAQLTAVMRGHANGTSVEQLARVALRWMRDREGRPS